VAEQKKRNMRDTMYNDMIFNKLTLGMGDDVRVLEGKGRFDKGNAKFMKYLKSMIAWDTHTK
jgi:hypothetical protein